MGELRGCPECRHQFEYPDGPSECPDCGFDIENWWRNQQEGVADFWGFDEDDGE